MGILNIPLCPGNNGANTGIPTCFFDPGKIKGVIVMAKTKYFTAANMADEATLLAAIRAATLATGSARIYPIFRFQAVTDNSEDTVKVTTGYGETDVAREGNYNWLFEIANGGMCYQKQLRKFNFNSGKWAVMLVDDENKLIGRVDASGNLYGFTTGILHAHPLKINDGSNNTKYNLEIGLPNPKQLNDQFGVVPFETTDIENDVLGLLDVELVQLAVASGKATIGARLNIGKTDLFPDLSALLDDPTLWTCTKAGAAVTITGVAASTVYDGWEISFTGTGDHVINLASPATLAAAHVGEAPNNGYEGIAVTVTMP